MVWFIKNTILRNYTQNGFDDFTGNEIEWNLTAQSLIKVFEFNQLVGQNPKLFMPNVWFSKAIYF